MHCSQGHAGCGEAFGVDIFINAGDTEVGEFDGAVASYQHILRLHVTMHDATAVGGTKAKRNVMGNNNGAVNGEDTTRTQVAPQVRTLDEFHNDKIIAIGLTIVVDRHDVGMVQARGRSRLTLKARHKLGRCCKLRARP